MRLPVAVGIAILVIWAEFQQNLENLKSLLQSNNLAKVSINSSCLSFNLLYSFIYCLLLTQKNNYPSFNAGNDDDHPKTNSPKSCCEDQNVPAFCLGLCMPQVEIGGRTIQRRRLNACSKHESVIKKCVQNHGLRVKEDGKVDSDEVARCGWSDWC